MIEAAATCAHQPSRGFRGKISESVPVLAGLGSAQPLVAIYSSYSSHLASLGAESVPYKGSPLVRALLCVSAKRLHPNAYIPTESESFSIFRRAC